MLRKVEVKLLLVTLITLLSAGCSVEYVIPGHDDEPTGHSRTTPVPDRAYGVSDAVPRAEPRARYGNPGSYRVFGKTYHVMDSSQGFVETGIASWYGPNFHGKLTSSREPYDMYKMTAAHKHLPLPTYVQVTNLENGRQVVVRVNDRGPFSKGRIIDLSYSAAMKLGIVRKGTARVEIRALDSRVPSADHAVRTAATTPTADGSVFLQAGAFSSETNARQLKVRLEDQLDNQISITTRPDPVSQLIRVRLGPLESVEMALRLAARLGDLGVQGARVIVD